MSIKYMKRVTISVYDAAIDKFGFEYNDELSTPGNGDIVIIPDNIQSISATLEVDTGSGKVQTTTSPIADVIAEVAGVVWVDWDSGVVTITTQDSSVPVTAIRQVNISGTTRLLLRTQ